MKHLLIVLTIIAGVFFLVWLFKSEVTQTAKSGIVSLLQNSTPTPTPFPFREITIPGLRARNYQGSLGSLVLYSESQNFTSYLTSYNSDGLKINGLLTKPKGEMPPGGFPAIVFIHGYIPPATYKTTERYVDYVNYLAANGFVVFKIDLRGNGQSEGDASGAYYSGDYIVDTLNAYSALQNSGFVNPAKIGLWGHSMAGNIVFRSFVVKKDIPAVVIWSGAGYTYADLLTYRITDNSYHAPAQTTETANKRKLLTDTYGQFNPNNDFWKQVPGTNYLDGVTGAIEINHAVDDPVVSIEYSRNLIKILDKTSIPHTLYEYPSGGHNIDGASFTEAMQRTVEFFKIYLK